MVYISVVIIYTLNITVLYLSGKNEMGANKTKAFVKTKEYVWHQNKDYVEKQLVDPPIYFIIRLFLMLCTTRRVTYNRLTIYPNR